jgi:3-methylcrotonyl-CoA carboxylase beta subunit
MTKRLFRSFPVIATQLDTKSPEFRDNMARNQRTAETIQTAIETACAGGGAKALERHTRINKKLFVRDRLKVLLDPGAPFLEFSQLAGLAMPYGDVRNAGLITGIGQIEGRMCVLTASDATVKAGSMYPISVKKQLRAQAIALQNRLPMVNLVDSGGAFLPLQAEIFPDSEHGGKTFANLAILSSKGIPVVTVVCGSCTAGAAYIPTMSQEAVIVKSIGSLYLAGPPLVKASTGEQVTSENLGGADVHCSISGCTDHYATNEQEALIMTRNIVSCFGKDGSPFSINDPDPPCYGKEELLGLSRGCGLENPMFEVIARIVDGSRFLEFKPRYGSELITGYAKIYGQFVGVVANNGQLTADAATKGSHFVQICNSRGIPLVFLCDVLDKSSSCLNDSGNGDAWTSGLALKAQAQMVHAVSLAKVPRITMVVGDSFGPTSFAMCSRSLEPNFVYMWPNAKIGAVRPEEVNGDDGTDDTLLARLDVQCESIYGSSRLWDDGIILPQNTREVLHLSLTAALHPYQPMSASEGTRTQAVMRM